MLLGPAPVIVALFTDYMGLMEAMVSTRKICKSFPAFKAIVSKLRPGTCFVGWLCYRNMKCYLIYAHILGKGSTSFERSWEACPKQ